MRRQLPLHLPLHPDDTAYRPPVAGHPVTFVLFLAAACLAVALCLPLPAQADPLPYWDLGPLYDPGQITLHNPSSLDAISGAPVHGVDLTGDGRAEVVLSAIHGDGPHHGPFRESAGEIHILLSDGSPIEGVFNFAIPNPRVMEILGANPLDYFGCALASGDVDGDARKDLIIGAFGSSAPGRSRAGRVYILFGDPPFPGSDPILGNGTVDLASGMPSNMTTILGSRADERLGVWSACRDVDNDGWSDLIMGADRADGPNNSKPQAGMITVLYGPVPRGVEIDLGNTPLRTTVIWGVDAEDHFGATITAGDFDHDGYGDIVGAAASHNLSRNVYDGGGSGDGPPGMFRLEAGEVWIIWGEASLPDTVDLSDPPDSVSLTAIYGKRRLSGTGEEMDVSDVNGDSVDDLLVGSLTATGPEYDYRVNAGEGYVFYGSAGFRDQVIDLASSTFPYFTVYGARGSLATDSFTSADVNNDGFGDLLVGMPRDPGPSGRRGGVLTVVYGSDDLPSFVDLESPTVPITILDGGDFRDNTAYWASSGDVDGDGYVDVIVNAMTGWGWRKSEPVAGDARVVSGHRLALAPEAPSNLRVLDSGSPSVLTVGWDPSPTSGVNGHIVRYRRVEDDQEASLWVPGKGVTQASLDLLPNHAYSVRIAAVARNVESQFSAPVVNTLAAPPAPANVTATRFCQSHVRLDWTPSTDPNLLGYAVYRRTDDALPTRNDMLGGSLIQGHSFEDTGAPAYSAVYYRVKAVMSVGGGIQESNPSDPIRVFTRSDEVGTGLLVVNDFDWFFTSDGPGPNKPGDPWEMYTSRGLTGDIPFEFWDIFVGQSVYPPGYVPLGKGTIDPQVLFDHSVVIWVGNGPRGATDPRMRQNEELLLEYVETGGVLVFVGWQMGSYLTNGFNQLLSIDEWDAPISLTASRPLVDPGGVFPDVAPLPTVSSAPFCDVPEFLPDAEGIDVHLVWDNQPEFPMMFSNNPKNVVVLSAAPSYLDPAALRATLEPLLEDLLGLEQNETEEAVTLEPTPAPLSMAYPNPARSRVSLDLQLPRETMVEVRVINARGQLVRNLGPRLVPAGSASLAWDGSDGTGKRCPAGVFFLKVNAGEWQGVRRILLLQ